MMLRDSTGLVHIHIVANLNTFALGDSLACRSMIFMIRTKRTQANNKCNTISLLILDVAIHQGRSRTIQGTLHPKEAFGLLELHRETMTFESSARLHGGEKKSFIVLSNLNHLNRCYRMSYMLSYFNVFYPSSSTFGLVVVSCLSKELLPLPPLPI